jgi:hypothetical protein
MPEDRETPSFHLPRTTEVEVSTAGTSPDDGERQPGTENDTGRIAQQRRGSRDNRESETQSDDINDISHSMQSRVDYVRLPPDIAHGADMASNIHLQVSKRQQGVSDHRESPKFEFRETRGGRFAGDTALHKAAAGGHETMTKLLLEGGANIELPNRMGQRALHLAAESGHL